jgi:hypothetical protein
MALTEIFPKLQVHAVGPQLRLYFCTSKASKTHTRMVVARVAGPRSENWEGRATKEGGRIFDHLLIYLMTDISLGVDFCVHFYIPVLVVVEWQKPWILHSLFGR